jgi:3-dehydroquinate synthase
MTIRHRNGSYPVTFGAHSDLRAVLEGGSIVITDTIVAGHYADLLEGLKVISVEPGERSKSPKTFSELCSKLAKERLSRKDSLVTFGGGVVGDLGGFVAATYMRGIQYTQIPTTLLAQVDSSVGGKVGIDLPEGKNLVGAFWPPSQVLICPEVLQTLSEREFNNGSAEVLKYAFIMDAGMLGAIGDSLSPSHPHVANIIRACIAHKAQVVAEDEFETNGLRAILNFGHTVGHAIELLLGYGLILHGEAISIGMVAEARLGERLGITPPGTTETVRSVLERQKLPVEHPILNDADSLLEAMRSDKKAHNGCLAFSLLTKVGGCKLVPGVDEALIREVLEQ